MTTVGAPLDPDHAADTDGRPGFAQVTLRGGGGEIHARGPQMLVGYLHAADDAESFDAEGYFRTGDLARWVDDDYLVITGRAKDIIIRNGENIAPKEIEDILISHPGVAEIAVVGLPDARTGERACAVVVPNDEPHPDVAEPARLPAIPAASPSSKRPSRWSSGRRYRETTPARCSNTESRRP